MPENINYDSLDGLLYFLLYRTKTGFVHFDGAKIWSTNFEQTFSSLKFDRGPEACILTALFVFTLV